MNSKELQKELNTIKQNRNSLLLKKLEDLSIEYNVLDSMEYGYFRVRVIIDSSLKDYVFSDIWYSKFNNGFVVRDYWRGVV